MDMVNSPQYWDELYRSNQTGWDMKGPTPEFEDLLQTRHFVPGKTLVLGCGKGHDAVLFAQHGFDVTAIDFSPTAIDAARRLATERGVHLTLVQEDVFDYSLAVVEEFDYIVEYVTFCAIDPLRRAEFASAVASMLKHNGEFLALFFPLDARLGGPPFAVSMDEVVRLFGRKLDLISVEAPKRSVPQRKGKELITVWRKP
ncbi:MAG: SAM-dependent methyltransferase [Ignavibacteria bacterium]